MSKGIKVLKHDALKENLTCFSSTQDSQTIDDDKYTTNKCHLAKGA